jgi:hypothetical protein
MLERWMFQQTCSALGLEDAKESTKMTLLTMIDTFLCFFSKVFIQFERKYTQGPALTTSLFVSCRGK